MTHHVRHGTIVGEDHKSSLHRRRLLPVGRALGVHVASGGGRGLLMMCKGPPIISQGDALIGRDM